MTGFRGALGVSPRPESTMAITTMSTLEAMPRPA